MVERNEFGEVVGTDITNSCAVVGIDPSTLPKQPPKQPIEDRLMLLNGKPFCRVSQLKSFGPDGVVFK